MASSTKPMPSAGRRRLKVAAVELAPIVSVVFLSFVAIGHIVQTDWVQVFFFNADSLALPLIEQSILHGEPFHFIFSSQNFLFPEGLLFLISTLFTDSPRIALIANASVNLVVLYLLLRAITHQLGARSRHRFVEISVALGATALFVIFTLLEPVPAVNTTGTATLYLFSTYYSGVIMAGLAAIALTLWSTKAFSSAPWGNRRTLFYVLAMTALCGLTTFSDPLFVFQVVAPLVGCVLVMVFVNRLSWAHFWLIVGATLIGTVLGFGLRRIFASLFASDVGNYLSLSHIPASIQNLYETVLSLLASGSGTLKLLLSGSIVLLAFAGFVFVLYSQTRPQIAHRISAAEIFIVSFVTLSTVSLIAGQIMTGSTTTRYLEPLMVFPLLSLLALGVYILRVLLIQVRQADLRQNLSRFSIGIAASAALLFVVVGSVNIAPISKAVSGVAYGPSACLENFVGDSKINGVGSFWSVRPLALYSDLPGKLLQIHDPLQVYPWMNNLGAYAGETFSYVVQDTSGQISAQSLAALGTPSQIVTCEGFQIFDYRGTAGEDTLTRDVLNSPALVGLP